MCLSIDTMTHSLDYQDHFKPKTTRLPKKVYKILYTRNNTYHTPYRGTAVDFKNKKAVLEEPSMMYYYENGWNIITVEIGIHAFYNKDVALARLALLNSENYAVFEAIIPPRTKYFIGVYGDIVSEKLIIKNKIVI